MPPFDPLDPEAPLDQRWTLATEAEVPGVGVHTGERTLLRLRPAPAGTGLVFRRVDLPGAPTIPASAAHLAPGPFATNLAASGTRVGTVEHVLAALWGLGVSDAWLDLEGSEVPIADGSALPFVEAVLEAGVVGLEAPRPFLALPSLGVTEGDRSVTSLPGRLPQVAVAVDYGAEPLGAALYFADLTPRSFVRELAPARTFARMADVEAMRAAGYARGGSPTNAVVVTEAGFSLPLRFPDEPVRHKALDLVGDLALLGAWWHGRVVAYKGGHALHTRLVAAIAAGASS